MPSLRNTFVLLLAIVTCYPPCVESFRGPSKATFLYRSSSINAPSYQQSASSSMLLAPLPSTTATTTALHVSNRRPFISGNWKLNPQTRNEAIQLASDIANMVSDTTKQSIDIALFVPYVFIESTMNVVQDKLMIGAEVRKLLA
jgi:Triosephosphate isomerase